MLTPGVCPLVLFRSAEVSEEVKRKPLRGQSHNDNTQEPLAPVLGDSHPESAAELQGRPAPFRKGLLRSATTLSTRACAMLGAPAAGRPRDPGFQHHALDECLGGGPAT